MSQTIDHIVRDTDYSNPIYSLVNCLYDLYENGEWVGGTWMQPTRKTASLAAQFAMATEESMNWLPQYAGMTDEGGLYLDYPEGGPWQLSVILQPTSGNPIYIVEVYDPIFDMCSTEYASQEDAMNALHEQQEDGMRIPRSGPYTKRDTAVISVRRPGY